MLNFLVRRSLATVPVLVGSCRFIGTATARALIARILGGDGAMGG